jgi:multiple sugar transport system permease protein
MMVSPIIRTFLYSFSEILLPNFETQFIGVKNFQNVFSRPEIATVLKNTFLWICGSVFLRFTMGFGAALVLNTEMRARQFFRVLALLPWTVPSIVSANTWRWMLQSDYGLINGILRSLGLTHLTHSWLGDPRTALFSVLIAYSWAGFPFVMIMLLAGMQGIPKDYYDAAKIDGCNAMQAFRNVTLPSLKAVIFVVLILEIVSGFNSFDLLFTMTGGGPGGASEILGLFIYRLAFTNFDFAGASAVSVVLILLGIVAFLLYVPASAKRHSSNNIGHL